MLASRRPAPQRFAERHPWSSLRSGPTIALLFCLSGTFAQLALELNFVPRIVGTGGEAHRVHHKGISGIGLWTGLGYRRTRSDRFGLVRATRDF